MMAGVSKTLAAITLVGDAHGLVVFHFKCVEEDSGHFGYVLNGGGRSGDDGEDG